MTADSLVRRAGPGPSATSTEALGLVPGWNPALSRADTLTADVEGLLKLRPIIGAPDWPLVDALRVPYGVRDPLTWLAEVPPTEQPPLEKATLAGQTVKVDASMGTQKTLAAWTDVSRQAGTNETAMAGIAAALASAVARDTDRYVATTLSAGAGFAAADGMAALEQLARWPGQRLIVLGDNGLPEAAAWQAYAEQAEGAIRVIVDPYIPVTLAIARIGVAVGILGPTTQIGAKASHFGVDIGESCTVAIEQAVGAVATWTPQAGGGAGTPPIQMLDDLTDVTTSPPEGPPEPGEGLIWDENLQQWVPGMTLDRRTLTGQAT